MIPSGKLCLSWTHRNYHNFGPDSMRTAYSKKFFFLQPLPFYLYSGSFINYLIFNNIIQSTMKINWKIPKTITTGIC
jgi:hypothetical protein